MTSAQPRMDREDSREVNAYLRDVLIHEPAPIATVRARAKAAGLPSEAVTSAQGKLLAMLVRVSRAKRVLEIGTLGGYSGAWILSALPEDGHLHSLEISRDRAAVARENLRLVDPAGEGSRWNIETGPAVKALHQLTWTRQAPFDVVFIDADPESYRTYLEWVLRLGAPGTVVVVGGLALGRTAALGEDDAARETAVRDALELLGSDPRFESSALQVPGTSAWDGVALAVMTSAGAPGSAAASVRVEPMTPETVRGALEVKNRGWRESFTDQLDEEWLDGMDARLDADVASWTTALSRPGNRTRSAVAIAHDGQVIGMATAAPVLEEADRLATGAKWELFTTYVDRAWQGSGVAKRLADMVLGDEPALVWVWEGNARAQVFYGKLGFLPDGAREDLPPEWNGAADIRMVRRA